jgi:hypothetical protein
MKKLFAPSTRYLWKALLEHFQCNEGGKMLLDLNQLFERNQWFGLRLVQWRKKLEGRFFSTPIC